MRKKNGFTLVEIIIAIMLVISVITLTIINTVRISKKKKEESYNLVVKQILVAAESYLEDNNFYKENLTDSNYIDISLGKLIKDDYLNVTTNPITNKKFDKCNYVKVTKRNNEKLKYVFRDNEKNCNDNNFVKVSPSISLNVEGKKGLNGWYKYNTDENPGVLIDINAIDKISGIASIEIKTNEGYKKLEMNPLRDKQGAYSVDNFSYSKTTNWKKVCYRATNHSGVYNETCAKLKVDANLPSCELSVIGDKKDDNTYVYYTSNLFHINLKLPQVILSYSDIGSGVYTKTISNDYNLKNANYNPKKLYTQGSKKNAHWSGSVMDYAGNINTCNKEFSVEEQKLTEALSKDYCGRAYGTSTVWTNENRTITQDFNKTLSSKKKSITKTFNVTTKTAAISNGNINCTVNVYVDKNKPEFDYINISNNTVRLYQWDSYGNQILSKDIYVVKQSNGKYYGEACVLNKPGYFDIRDYDIIAKDEESGINNNSYETTWNYYSLSKNKEIGAQCLKSAGDNPCLMKEHVYVYDNAGNISDDIGKLEIKIGYKSIDNFCR